MRYRAYALVVGHQPDRLGCAQLKPVVGLRLAPRATAATTPFAELPFQGGLRAFERGEDLARSTGAFVGHHSAPLEPVIDDLDAGAPVGGNLDLLGACHGTELRRSSPANRARNGPIFASE